MTQEAIPIQQRTIRLESQSAKIGLSSDEIRARYLSIDIEIEARTDSVGTANFERYIPRIWSGYCYLINNNSVISTRTIEYKNNRIYQKEFQSIPWLMNRGYGVVGATYDQLGNIVDNEPWKHRDAWWSYAEMLFNNVGSAGSYLTHLIDSIAVYIPLGVDVLVKINHIPYEEIFKVSRSEDGNWSGTFEDLNELIPIPYEPVNDDILGDVDRPPNLQDYVQQKGYILSSECPNFLTTDLKERIDRTTADLQRVVSNLLSQGAITQADIDAIKAINPSIQNADLIKQLIDAGLISSAELDRAIERATLESYIAPPGKKAGWFVLSSYRRSDCSIAYDLYSLYGIPQSFIGLSPMVSNSPVVPDINWATAINTSPLLLTDVVQQDVVSWACGDVTDRFRVGTGRELSPEFFVQSRSQGSPRIFYRIQP